MFNLIRYEFIKLFQKRKLIIFLLFLCIINVGVFAYVQNLNTNIPPSAYHQLQNDLQQINNNERYTFIKNQYETYHAYLIIEELMNLRLHEKDNQYMIDSILTDYPNIEEKYGKRYQENHTPYYTSDLESEVSFFKEVLQEFQLLNDYPAYIRNIQEKAETISQISIFQTSDSLEQKNIQKTAQDYQSLINTPIVYESEKGIFTALSFPATSFFIMLSMMVLVSSLILEEKEKKLFSIIKITPQGQYPTMIAKCFVMFVVIGIITSLMIFGQFIYASIIYGLGDLSRSVQSLSHYYQCPFAIDVQQFIGLFILIKWLAASLIGLIMLFIATLSKNKVLAVIMSFAVIMIEYILYLFIPSLDSLYLLKYFNIIAILQTDAFFQIYRNVYLFGNLMSLQMFILVGLLCLLMFFVLINILVYHYKRNMALEMIEFPHFFCLKHVSLSLFFQECYKIFSIQKVFILCILCIGIQCYQYQHISIYVDNEERTYQQYMQKLSGALTKEKEQWILDVQKHYQDLNQQLADISNKRQAGLITQIQANMMQIQIEEQLRGEQVFQKVLEQFHDIQAHPQKQFVYPTAYQQYFIETHWTFMPILLCCLFVIIGLCQVTTYEYQNQMNRITQMTSKGNHDLLRIKCYLAIMIGILFLLIVSLPPLFLIHKTYGFSSLFAPAFSLADLSIFPSWISVGMLCLINFLLKIEAIIVIVIGMMSIGVKVRNHLLTLFISLCIFLLPLLFAYGGYHFLDSLSLYPLFFSGQFVSTYGGLLQILFSFVGYSVFALFGLRYLYKNYQRSEEFHLRYPIKKVEIIDKIKSSK